MKKTNAIAVLAFMGLIGISQGQSQDSEITGFHQHDGFFLRMQGGAGSGKMVEVDIEGSDMTLSGAAGSFRLQIGGTVAENLILFGEMGAFVLSDPNLEWQNYSGAMEGVNLSISDFGGGLSYYFMPSNIYLSGSLTISRDKIELEELNREASTQSGIGFYFSAGKEWWISGDWALGLAGFFYYSKTIDKNESANVEYTVKNTVFGLAFSATYH